MDTKDTNPNLSENIKPKSKLTLFLERNEIWFKTVLSLILTLAALFVSIATYNNSKTQADRQNREKTAFFTIENIFDKESKQYNYIIKNTGGAARSCSVTLHPFLYIYQDVKRDSRIGYVPLSLEQAILNEPTNQAFIYLPDFYTPINPSNYENAVFAFSDVWIDSSVDRSFPELNVLDVPGEYHPQPELADDYFTSLVTNNNVDSLNTRMNSQIVYYVQIHYSNYENQSLIETFWLARSADKYAESIGQRGNCILSFRNSIEEKYYSAQKNGDFFIIDSLNLPIQKITEESKHIIAELLTQFGQTKQ